MDDDDGTAQQEEPAEETPDNVVPMRQPEGRGQRPKEEGKRSAGEEAQARQRREFARAVRKAASDKRKELDKEGIARFSPALFELTDLGNANRLEFHFGNALRYVAPWKKWLWRDGLRWRRDTRDHIHKCAVETAYRIALEAELLESNDELASDLWEHYIKSQQSGKINAMIALARHKLAIEPEETVSTAEHLMTSSGLVDLRTGELCATEAQDYGLLWTHLPFDPDAQCPTWEKFVFDAMDEDEEMVAYLQRLSGYAATGYAREHCMPMFAPTPNSGKGTFLRTLTRVLGDYAIPLNMDFLNKKGQAYVGHPTDINQLRGVRLGLISELAADQKLNEQRFKVLTGGDDLDARGIAQDFSQFQATHTLILQTNNLPVIESQDEGTWRRIWVVPWTKAYVHPDRWTPESGLPKADLFLEEKLGDELPGILAWVVRGAVAWFERGSLAPPQKVKDATSAYREEQDPLFTFRRDYLEPKKGERTLVRDVHAAYAQFQEGRGEQALTLPVFGKHMKVHYKVKHSDKGNYYQDVVLKALKAPDKQPGE